MGNMSYCMFKNTYSDLLQCYEAMKDKKELSELEAQAKNKLLRLCKNIIDDFYHTLYHK